MSSQQVGVNDGSRPELRSNTLQSWKEIASYLKRGVRTVQRWERNSGLPVRRPRPGDRSPVFAFPEELDVWMRSRKRAMGPTIAISSRRDGQAGSSE
jgi:hypothetical protein